MKAFIATALVLFSLNATAQVVDVPSMDFTAMNKAIEAAATKSAAAKIGKVTNRESLDNGYYLASNSSCEALVKVKFSWATFSWKATTLKTTCK